MAGPLFLSARAELLYRRGAEDAEKTSEVVHAPLDSVAHPRDVKIEEKAQSRSIR
jgi:hypothetical protein